MENVEVKGGDRRLTRLHFVPRSEEEGASYEWTCTSLLTSQREGKWQMEKKNRDPAPELVLCTLKRSFSCMSHQCGHNSLSPIAADAVDMYEHAHAPTHIALWLKVMGEGPGGHENAFCDPVYTTSMPQ